MDRKLALEEMGRKLKRAFSPFDYHFRIETNIEHCRIGMHFSSDTVRISPTAIENFRSVVGVVGIFVWEDHIELYGYPLLF